MCVASSSSPGSLSGGQTVQTVTESGHSVSQPGHVQKPLFIPSV